MDKHENNGNFFDSLVDGVYNFNWLLLLSVAISYLYIISTSFDDFLRKQKDNHYETGELNSVGHITKLGYMLVFSVLLYLFMNSVNR